jgi:general secretion pathway protein F
MPVYKYRALDGGENLKTGVIEAANTKEARMTLLGENLFLLDIRNASGEKGSPGTAAALLGGKKADELALVTRQFATLTRAGVPIADALAALVEVIESPKLKVAFLDIKECVTSGMSLEEALKRHPRYFSPFYVSMVRVGEASGNMDEVLTRLSKYLHSQARVRAKIIAAITYPALMLSVGFLVVTFLVTFVVPRITQVLTDSGRTLPAPTLILIGVSDFIGRFWWLIAACIILAYVLYRAAVATERGRLARDSAMLKIPVLGTLLKKHLVARFAMTLATLLKSGVPALQALEIVKDTVRNKVLEKTISDVHDRIIEGSDISTIIRKSGVFPPLVAYMIAVGEQSGRLEEMLEILSEYYDEEIETATARFLSVLGPILIVFLAALVGFVVLSIMLPIMDMGQTV